MGCSNSQQAEPAYGYSNHNTFKVTVLDSRGQNSCTGQLKVTFQELILYQKGKDSKQWPLWGLRRYGCDKDLFSFESGRRCPTGPGIHVFRCHQAEALFNLLQVSILWTGQSQQSHLSAFGSWDPALQAAVLTQMRGAFEANETTGAMNAVHDYINDPANSKYYNINQHLQPGLSTGTQYVDLEPPAPDGDDAVEDLYTSNNKDLVRNQTTKSTKAAVHAYVNVEGNQNKKAYVNVPLSNEKSQAYVNVPSFNANSSDNNQRLSSCTQVQRPKSLEWQRHMLQGCTFENCAYMETAKDGPVRRNCDFLISGSDKEYLSVAGERRSLALPSSQKFCIWNDSRFPPKDKDGVYAAIDFDKTVAAVAVGQRGSIRRRRKACHSCDVEAMYYC